MLLEKALLSVLYKIDLSGLRLGLIVDRPVLSEFQHRPSKLIRRRYEFLESLHALGRFDLCLFVEEILGERLLVMNDMRQTIPDCLLVLVSGRATTHLVLLRDYFFDSELVIALLLL